VNDLFGPEPIDPELPALPALAELLAPLPLPSDSVGDPPSPVEPGTHRRRGSGRVGKFSHTPRDLGPQKAQSGEHPKRASISVEAPR
jgi:hypothetical protein